MDSTSHSPAIEWGVAWQAAPGESVSGDAHLVLLHPSGALLAVIDGSGHGPLAAEAAELAVATLREVPTESVLNHFSRCHAALTGTRGAVMTLADFNQAHRTVTLSGVGNVEAMLFRAKSGPGLSSAECASLRSGIVGDHLPSPYAVVIPVEPADVLVMVTDGVRPLFNDLAGLGLPAQRLADQLLRQHSRGNDDALVLVARFPLPSLP